MTVTIGSARVDENRRATGGRAGDQTSSEVSAQAWYGHPKGWRVFRAKDRAVAEKIAHCMRAACDNGHIGYDQGQRNALYRLARPMGFDCSKVAVDCETDCSALVRVCCAYAGIMLPDFNTSTEAAALLKSGAFSELTEAKYTASPGWLRRGDILVTRTKGHTAVVLTDGARGGQAGCVAITGRSVWVRKGPGTQYGRLGVVHAGDRLAFGGTAASNGLAVSAWLPVIYGGEAGWVSGRYAKLV